MGLPAGDYIGRVAIQITDNGEMTARFGRSMTKGTPQVKVLCEVASGPRIGEQMEWIGYLSGGALDRTLRSLRTMGFESDDIDTFADQRPEDMFSFTVGDEEYKGRVNQKIQWINPLGAAFSADDLKALSRELRPKLAQFQANGASEDAPPPLDDSDQPLF